MIAERKAHRRQAQQKVYTQPQAGLGVQSGKTDPPGQEEEDLNQHERERVIELMLSQERVIALLYDKTFTMTSMEANPPGMHEDIEALRR